MLVLQTERLSTLRLREWAQALPQGLLVGLGDPSEIRIARRELADCENILFASGSREEIPWRDGFFTVIFDTEGEAETPDGTPDVTPAVTQEVTPQVTKDMRRVLHPSGRIYSIQP